MFDKQALLDAINDIESRKIYGPVYFFTAGTGLPCKLAIEYFKDCDVIVVDRKNRMWKNGVLCDNVTQIK